MIFTTPITLIGMSGSGKTTIGRKLAETLAVSFYDTDQIITERAGMSPSEIFAAEGEAAFRRLELDVIRTLLKNKDNGIISTGGGAVIQPAAADLVFNHSLSIWLDVEGEELWRRQKQNIGTRPMLDGKDPKQRMLDLLQQRRPVYEKADKIIPAGQMKVDDIVDHIISKLRGINA